MTQFDRSQFVDELVEFNPFNLFFILEKTGKIVDFNHNLEKLFGWNRAEIVDRYWFEIIHEYAFPFQLEQMPEILEGNLNSGQVFTTNVHSVAVSTKWQAGVSKARDKLFLYGLNISEFVKRESVARSYVEELINNIPHNIFWKDSSSKFLGCNDAFAQLIGFQCAKEIVGKNDYDLPWLKEESDLYIRGDQAIIDSGVAKLNYEETQTLRDGTKKISLVSKVPIKDNLKKVLGVLGIYTDITIIKEKELSLVHAIRQAEQALASKDEFILNMEHDLRTPFSGLYGLAKILYDDEVDETKKELLGDIAHSAKALLDHCDSILSFAKTEHGGAVLVDERFELKALIEQVVAMEKPACIENKLVLLVEYEEGRLPQMVKGSRHGLLQILLNLVGNAIKFTEAGYVKLMVKLAKEDQANGKSYICFMVQDSGVGIDKSKQQIVFEKFSRLTEANTGKYKGLGLGLAIVKKLVASMQGEIEVKSEVGKGTTFICTLPFFSES